MREAKLSFFCNEYFIILKQKTVSKNSFLSLVKNTLCSNLFNRFPKFTSIDVVGATNIGCVLRYACSVLRIRFVLRYLFMSRGTNSRITHNAKANQLIIGIFPFFSFLEKKNFNWLIPLCTMHYALCKSLCQPLDIRRFLSWDLL